MPPSVILGLGWGWLLVYAFPGIMTLDSLEHLREGRDWFFTDSHPPVMAAMWGVVDRVLPGPLGMLVIQGTAFLLGLYLVLRRTLSPRRAAWCAVAIFVFPPVFVPFAVIWKDCVMAGALVLGLAALLHDCRQVRLLGLASFTLATALRYNAPGATLPLVVLLFEWERGMRWLERYAIAVVAWLAVTLAAFGINKLITDREMHFWHMSMALADITGVLQFVDETLPDEQLRPLLAPTEIRVDRDIHDRIRWKYRSDDFQQLISGAGQLWDVPWTSPMPEARREAISHAWSTLLAEHPGAFLRYRLENFGEILGVNERFGGAVVVPHRAQYPGMLDYMGMGRGSSKFQRFVQNKYLWLAKHTRLFRPHVYALLALGLLLLAFRQRDVLAILLSGIGMELTLLVLGGTPDYRYSHWLIVCVCVALVVLVARRARGPT